MTGLSPHKIPWIGTSWKMNKSRAEAYGFAETLRTSPVARSAAVKPFVLPPFPYISGVADILKGTIVAVGGQNMHWADAGAWTGEISPLMLKDCGAIMVELGHSERRRHFGETDETVALKVEAALRHGLTALVCIGDNREEHAAGGTAAVLETQLRALLSRVGASALGHVLVAYEPVWSIGEGGTPAAPAFVNAQHQRLANIVGEITGGALPLLYGGSVNLENCVELACQPHVDGLFIGRAAWDASGYMSIINSVTTALETS